MNAGLNPVACYPSWSVLVFLRVPGKFSCSNLVYSCHITRSIYPHCKMNGATNAHGEAISVSECNNKCSWRSLIHVSVAPLFHCSQEWGSHALTPSLSHMCLTRGHLLCGEPATVVCHVLCNISRNCITLPGATRFSWYKSSISPWKQ